jgi:hypothetical protein
MLSPSDTAYPVLKANPSARELTEIFTPTLFELAFAEERAREPVPMVGSVGLPQPGGHDPSDAKDGSRRASRLR